MVKEVHFKKNDLTFFQKDNYTYVELKDSQREFGVGYPDLPLEVLTFIIPWDVEIDSLELVSLKSEELEGEYYIPLVKPDIKTDGSLSLNYQEVDSSGYNLSSLYPRKLARVLSDGYLGKNHLVTLAIYPLQYFPSDKKLVFHHDIELRLIFKQNLGGLSLPANSITSQKILKDLVYNQEDILSYSPNISLPKYTNIPTSAKYIVITNQEIKDAFIPLVEWKTKKGVKAKIVTVDDIYNSYTGVDLAEKIRNFLIDAHQDGLEWVLLGGDEDIVPIRYAYQGNTSTPPPIISQQICDLYYADLTGDWDKDKDGIWGEPFHDSPDIYPEIFVGRVPSQNSQEAEYFVEKLLSYEQNPNGGDFNYLTRALWMCSDQMRDWNQGEGQHRLVSQYLPDNFYQDLANLVESPSGGASNPVSPEGAECIELMSQGWGITGIFAHGRTDGFVASSDLINQWPKSYVFSWSSEEDGHGHLPLLSNQGRYGIVYSVSCNQAAIDYEDNAGLGGGPSVAEAYILSKQKGAIAFLGYSRWGWVSSSYKLTQKFMQELFDSENGYHIGVAEVFSKLYYPYYWDLNYGHNLYGDPEMQVWTQIPVVLDVVHPQKIKIGTQELEFQVSSNGNSVPQAKICITEGNEILFLGETDEEGNLNAQLSVDYCTELAVTITKANFIPYQGTIEALSTADVDEEENLVPLRFELSQNYPNPFNPITQIDYQIAKDGYVLLEIFNVLGQKVKTLVSENQMAGNYTVIWNGTDDNNRKLPSGIYFYRLTSSQNIETKKMALLK